MVILRLINWPQGNGSVEETNLDNYHSRPTRLKCSGNEYELTATTTSHRDEYGFRGSLPLELTEDMKRTVGSSSVKLTRKPMVYSDLNL